MTVYNSENTLVSLGDTAFQNYQNELVLNIPFVRYIGKYAFQDCLKLKTIDFSNKTDSDIPVLASPLAFMKSDETSLVNDYFKILVPN